ncbi:SRPBCC family protein [Leptospira wolffii]|uniref:SRPBCC family protein n=1 Tax=Leptospira wolffii TaxID=409998 RepID=UPI0002D58C94|nr:SRPBCC domain-containing protein [Leptospira wolffii]EPG68170.1 putative lipoprotein [Leptospira wolffii serovar Khorat str. Khorat-H2]
MVGYKKFLKWIVTLNIILFLGCATSKGSVSNEAGEDEIFRIERSFDADAKTVFDMWIRPDRFSKWLGPKGASMYFMKVGVKEGESSQWSMTTSDGQTKYGKLNYKKIHPNDLLVYTQNFCDKEGKLTKLPFAPDYPDMVLTMVSFISEGPKKTRVSVKWEVFGEATEKERQTFLGLRPVMTVGWGESFDKLTLLLKMKR